MSNHQENYISWKNWDQNSFGIVNSGARFYFDQFFAKYKLLNPNINILEVGFGNGELLGYLSADRYHLHGVEINSSLTNRAIAKGFDAFTGLVWDIAALDKKKFDLIIAIDVVEHMDRHQLDGFFAWASTHLSEQGNLVLRFPEGASPFSLPYQNGDFTHVSALTKNKLISLASKNNLRITVYDNEYLRSDTLCSRGLVGKMALLLLQAYAKILRLFLRLFLYPLCIDLKLSTNSIVIMNQIENS